jgi:type II secretory pathway pseudopilin PulG
MSIKRADGGGTSRSRTRDASNEARQAEAERRRAARQEAARKAAEQAASAQAAQQAAAQAARTASRQSSFEPAATRNTVNLNGGPTPPASSLLTENTRDGSVNCLDRAADWVARSTPALQARSELVFLEDGRAGREGQSGHVVVRQGERVVDPGTGRSYEDLPSYLREQPQYREVGTMSGTAAAQVFATEPGSPERAQALAGAQVSPELQRMMVADPTAIDPMDVPVDMPDTTGPDYALSSGGPSAGLFTLNPPQRSGGPQVQAGFGDALAREVVHADGYATVTLSAESSVSASGGFDIRVVSVGGGGSTGTQQTYEVRMRDEDFERLQRGEIPPPHPLVPSTLPDGASVRLEQARLSGPSMEGGFNALGLELGGSNDFNRGQGLSIEMTRTGDSVRVTAGPRQIHENDGSIEAGVGFVSVTGGSTDTLTTSQLRTATFDLSSPEGRAAFESFRDTGQLPEANGPGVSEALRMERLQVSSQGSVELGIGPLDVGGDVPGITSDMLITHHPDGTTSRSMDVVYEGDHPGFNLQQRLDASGQFIPGSETYTYTFDGLDMSTRGRLAQAFGGDAALAEAARASTAPLTLTLNQDQVRQLQEVARAAPRADLGMGSLLSDYNGNPSDPLTAALTMASSGTYNETVLAQQLFILTGNGTRPLSGDLQLGD